MPCPDLGEVRRACPGASVSRLRDDAVNRRPRGRAPGGPRAARGRRGRAPTSLAEQLARPLGSSVELDARGGRRAGREAISRRTGRRRKWKSNAPMRRSAVSRSSLSSEPQPLRARRVCRRAASNDERPRGSAATMRSIRPERASREQDEHADVDGERRTRPGPARAAHERRGGQDERSGAARSRTRFTRGPAPSRLRAPRARLLLRARSAARSSSRAPPACRLPRPSFHRRPRAGRTSLLRRARSSAGPARATLELARTRCEVLVRRLGRVPREPVGGKRSLEPRVGRDHGASRVGLGAQVVECLVDDIGEAAASSGSPPERGRRARCARPAAATASGEQVTPTISRDRGEPRLVAVHGATSSASLAAEPPNRPEPRPSGLSANRRAANKNARTSRRKSSRADQHAAALASAPPGRGAPPAQDEQDDDQDGADRHQHEKRLDETSSTWSAGRRARRPRRAGCCRVDAIATAARSSARSAERASCPAAPSALAWRANVHRQ